MRKFNNFLNEKSIKAKVRMGKFIEKTVGKLQEKDGNFFEEGIKWIIAFVVGALLLGGIYLLFKDIILPTITSRVQQMFNYS
ncbi:hypothetical protein acsn021_11040 [Anaerocolumna cellulosilytica]|uniref:Uncharacterized protein n=1 Tax=Anaerocolumna cellulosilytica TaxID=433286 RepID=A0A6S6R1V8_9FIRM|nr:DUF6133 family protein [Anaerocolumna cellulosilytica]MBB5194591.1 hypothetical protein [Anaerocolumna cellulosilytica]BCJ93535.1 hypothetical protein acsn021_11040 [Anaerocolumna cellulosilytica]